MIHTQTSTEINQKLNEMCGYPPSLVTRAEDWERGLIARRIAPKFTNYLDFDDNEQTYTYMFCLSAKQYERVASFLDQNK